jgi:hypothetical protein
MREEPENDLNPKVHRVRRGGALVLAIVLFLAAPMMSVASAAAEPLTIGEWLSVTFGSLSQKVDPAQKGVGVAAPQPPPPQLQASSEPAPPKTPAAASTAVPRLWVQRQTIRRKRRRRAR